MVQLIREPEVAFRVIVKLLTRIFSGPDILSDPAKRGGRSTELYWMITL